MSGDTEISHDFRWFFTRRVRPDGLPFVNSLRSACDQVLPVCQTGLIDGFLHNDAMFDLNHLPAGGIHKS